jgi:hypothetical protein
MNAHPVEETAKEKLLHEGSWVTISVKTIPGTYEQVGDCCVVRFPKFVDRRSREWCVPAPQAKVSADRCDALRRAASNAHGTYVA